MDPTRLIDVALTRAQARETDVAVVIDVLRATSTVAQALSAGYRRVLCADGVETAARLRAPGRVLAGERSLRRPEGFDQGNSPAEAAVRRGEELVLATTNGAPATVEAAARAPRVLLASLLNLASITRALASEGAGDVQIICAGIEGATALEDVYVAGRLSSLLSGTRTESALVAEGVARSFRTPLRALQAGGGGTALAAAGLAGDVALCARESTLDVVPTVVAVEPGIAVVDRAGHGAASIRRRRAARGARPGRAGRTARTGHGSKVAG